MPFLAKMSNHFRGGGYSAKEPKSKSIYNRDEDYYPAKHERRLHAKDKIDDYDCGDCRNDEDNLTRKSSRALAHAQGNKREDERDVDWLYCRSKEKFASWHIRDLEDRSQPDKKTSSSKRNQREILADLEVEEIFVNGKSSSPSPTNKRNGASRVEERFGRRQERASQSPIEQHNGIKYRASGKRPNENWSEVDTSEPPKVKTEERMKPSKNGSHNNNNNSNKNRDQLLKDIESFGSLKKRNEKNSGLNLGFRAIVEKFRSKSDDKDKKETSQKNKKKEYVDDDWRYDNGHVRERKSPDKYEAYPPKESKTERNHRIRDNEYERHEPSSRRRSPSRNDEDRRQGASRSKHQDDKAKRRSYAFEASPEDFEVRIQKYERARRDDPQGGESLHRCNSFHDRASKDSEKLSLSRDNRRDRPDVVRKSSLRDNKDKDSSLNRRESSARIVKSPKPRVSERHSRPLTPPNVADHRADDILVSHHRTDSIRDPEPPRKSFSMKEWYESNRQFAAKYLKEHSKLKELSTTSCDISAKDEFVFDSPKQSRTVFEIGGHEREIYRGRPVDGGHDDDEDEARRRGSYVNETSTVVKVLTNAEDENSSARRRRGDSQPRAKRFNRRYEEEEEEEDEAEIDGGVSPRRSASYERSFVMPARKLWNYRDEV